MFIRKILVPIDFSPRSRPALECALELARNRGATVDLLHVVPAPSLASVAADLALDRPVALLSPEVLRSAEAQLEALLAEVDTSGAAVRTRVQAGDAAGIILNAAADEPYDLIVIGTRGRHGVAELVLGSVARRLIVEAPCPVVTLRATEPADAKPAAG